MPNTITSSSSSCSYFNNGTRICQEIHDSPKIKWLKKIDQSRLSFKYNTKTESSRVLYIRTRAASSSSSSSPSSTPPSSSPWKKWLWGFLLTIVLPAAGHKGGLLIALKGKIDQAVATVEHVTEVVEEIAEEAERIVEEVEEKLPGDSKLKEALESFDHLAKMAVDEAKKAEDIIHKVKDVEEETDGMLLKVVNKQQVKK